MTLSSLTVGTQCHLINVPWWLHRLWCDSSWFDRVRKNRLKADLAIYAHIYYCHCVWVFRLETVFANPVIAAYINKCDVCA